MFYSHHYFTSSPPLGGQGGDRERAERATALPPRSGGVGAGGVSSLRRG